MLLQNSEDFSVEQTANFNLTFNFSLVFWLMTRQFLLQCPAFPQPKHCNSLGRLSDGLTSCCGVKLGFLAENELLGQKL